jgi:long-chain acyl-CoA synthetase
MYPGKWAPLQPDKPAAIDSGSGEQITFAELNDRSNQLAQLLYDRDLRRGDHIAIFTGNDLRYFEVAWAALRSGLFFTTVNRSLTAEEAGYIVNDCEARALVVSASLESVAQKIPDYAPKCDTLLSFGGPVSGYLALETEIEKFPASPLAEEPLGSFMLYSSGTTGRPKGVKHPLLDQSVADDNDHHLFHQQLWNFAEDTVYLSPAPIYHAAPAFLSVSTQALGGTVVLMPKFDPLNALEAIERYRVTHSQWVPTMFIRFLKLSEEDRTRFDLTSHTTAIHAAAPCPIEVKRKMLDWWGPIINEYYAGTEAPGSTHVTAEEWLRYPGTVGKSMGGPLHL